VVETAKEQGLRRCPDCLELVPYQVRICPNCKAYQDWRRYAGFSQTTLALLVALISVSTAAIPVIERAVTPNDSNLNVDFEEARGLALRVLISNTGNRTATVFGGELLLPDGLKIPLKMWSGRPYLAIPGKTEIVDLEPTGTTLDRKAIREYDLAKLKDGTCLIGVDYKSFTKQQKSDQLSVACNGVRPFIETVQKLYSV